MEKGPEERSPEINNEIVNELLLLAMRWGGASAEDTDGYREDLLAVLHNSFSDDGYDLACDLDNKGWEVNAELVEILDAVGRLRHKWYQILRSRWVQENDIVIPFNIGDLVQAPRRKPQYVVKLMPGTAEVGLADDRLVNSPGPLRWYTYPVEIITLVESVKK